MANRTVFHVPPRYPRLTARVPRQNGGVEHATLTALEAGLDAVRRSPADAGLIELVIRRPAEGERESLVEATLDRDTGLVGDNWRMRGSRRTADGSADPDAQVTVMNSRAAALFAG